MGSGSFFPHPRFRASGNDDEDRRCAYDCLVRESISDDDLQVIRSYVQQQRALGSSPSQTAREAAIWRSVGVRPCGRPARSARRTLSEVNEPDPFVDPFVDAIPRVRETWQPAKDAK